MARDTHADKSVHPRISFTRDGVENVQIVEGIIVRFVDGDQDPVQLVTRVPQRDLVLLQTEEIMLQARARTCGFVDTRHARAASWTQGTRERLRGHKAHACGFVDTSYTRTNRTHGHTRTARCTEI